MKTISAALDAHLAQEVTTLCTCWKIVRKDGEVFGFTDHDQDIVFDGVLYESETGYNRTAISSDASLSVDNLDVTGFLESERISETDLRNGLFDFASVYIFALNWANHTAATAPTLTHLNAISKAATDAAAADNVLTSDEKQNSFKPAVDAIEDRYQTVFTQATGLALDTTALTTARNSFWQLLNSYVPAWDDDSQNTQIAENLTDPTLFPSDWGAVNGASANANGIYTTVGDQGSLLSELRNPVSNSEAAMYSFGLVIKKDSVPQTTRSVCIGLHTGGGTFLTGRVVMDTMTGEIARAAGSEAIGIVDLGSEWFLWASMTADPDNVTIFGDIYPAWSSDLSATNVKATTGFVDVREPVLVVGDSTKLGRFMLAGLLNAYTNEVEALWAQINEGDDWTTATQDSDGEMKLRRGWFGEVILNRNGSFETEIRGLHQALSYSFMESYQPECRADFCDKRCTLNIADYTFASTVLAVTNNAEFQATSLPAVPTVETPSVGAHRYWRIRPTGAYYTNYVGFAEIHFFDQDGNEINGGETDSFSHRADSTGIAGVGGNNYKAKNARDGHVKTSWQCADGDVTTSWWSIDFGNDKDVGSVTMRAPSGDFHVAPTAFDLEYSDNGSNWDFAMSCTGFWQSNGQEETWLIGNATSDPIDVATDFEALPPPAAGASTYIGGTVTFVTGPNTGKTTEIVDYDEATCTVSLLEETWYPISPGDKFSITQGCDKRFATCKVYSNQNNFRGEPTVPGQDEYLSYPDAHDD